MRIDSQSPPRLRPSTLTAAAAKCRLVFTSFEESQGSGGARDQGPGGRLAGSSTSNGDGGGGAGGGQKVRAAARTLPRHRDPQARLTGLLGHLDTRSAKFFQEASGPDRGVIAILTIYTAPFLKRHPSTSSSSSSSPPSSSSPSSSSSWAKRCVAHPHKSRLTGLEESRGPERAWPKPKTNGKRNFPRV